MYTDAELDEMADSLRAWVDESIKVDGPILLTGWCLKNNFYPQKLKWYASKHLNFKLAYFWAKAWEEHSLTHLALMGKIDSSFASFCLSCNHGWKLHYKCEPVDTKKTSETTENVDVNEKP